VSRDEHEGRRSTCATEVNVHVKPRLHEIGATAAVKRYRSALAIMTGQFSLNWFLSSLIS
jgi:hypothetical protein